MNKWNGQSIKPPAVRLATVAELDTWERFVLEHGYHINPDRFTVVFVSEEVKVNASFPRAKRLAQLMEEALCYETLVNDDGESPDCVAALFDEFGGVPAKMFLSARDSYWKKVNTARAKEAAQAFLQENAKMLDFGSCPGWNDDLAKELNHEGGLFAVFYLGYLSGIRGGERNK